MSKIKGDTENKVKKNKSKESQEKVNEVLKDKKYKGKTHGQTNTYEGKGGYEKANRDFNRLNKGKTKTYPNGTKVGKLPDGTSINVRPKSSKVSGDRPTLEIQGKGRLKIKIRY